MTSIQLLASVLVPILTEDGNPPEDEGRCEHGNDPDSCFECSEEDIAASHAQAEADWDPEDEPL